MKALPIVVHGEDTDSWRPLPEVLQPAPQKNEYVQHIGLLNVELISTSVASNYEFTAIACSDGRVKIWKSESITSATKKPEPAIILAGHTSKVTAICFGNKNPALLCTACQDKIYLWNLEKVLQGASQSSTLLGSQIGYVEYIAMDETDETMAICVENTILVFDMIQFTTTMQLEGHTGIIKQACFGKSPNTLISISEDRTFKVWDLQMRMNAYKSGIVSIYPFSALDEDPHHPRVAVGSTEGKIRMYDTRDYRLVHTIDLNVLAKRMKEKSEGSKPPPFTIVSSEPLWKQQANQLQSLIGPPEDEADEQVNNSILFLRHISATVEKNSEAEPISILIACTPSCVCFINPASAEVMHVYMLVNETQSGREVMASFETYIRDPKTIILLASSTFRSSVHLYSINFEQLLVEYLQAGSEAEKQFSIFADRPLPEKLLSDFAPSAESSKPKGKVVDKPVTFHSKVKSSGYGSKSPVMTLGGRKPKPKPKEAKPSSKLLCNLNSGIPSNFKDSAKIHHGSILKIKFSRDGTKLATCSSDFSCRVVKMPLNAKSETTSFLGHSSSVSYVSWSANQKYMLSSSLDGTAHLWQIGKSDPLIQFKQVSNNITPPTQSKPATPNKAGATAPKVFHGEVNTAQFYHMDKLIAVANSNKIYLYKYYIQPAEKDQILKKQLVVHKYKLVQQLQSSSQTISCLGCPNTFLSNYIIFGGSNKNLELYDVCSNSIARTIEQAHERPIHSIHIQEPSQYVEYTQATCHNLQHFLTSAVDGCVKLWDIRAKNCVRRFAGHKNSVNAVHASISPCFRFVATGSEDRCAYVYDLKSGSVLAKLQGHTDTVSDAQFHPLHSQVYTSAFDGVVRMYNDVISK